MGILHTISTTYLYDFQETKVILGGLGGCGGDTMKAHKIEPEAKIAWLLSCMQSYLRIVDGI